jgi:hypothetical protein
MENTYGDTRMMLNRLMTQLKERGLEVVAGKEPGSLALRGPANEKTGDIINALKLFKPQLLEMVYGKSEDKTAGE